MKIVRLLIIVIALAGTTSLTALAQRKAPTPAIIAYYAGNPTMIDSFDVTRLTHLIFSFGHLQGNRLHISNARDTLTIQNLVAQKAKNPDLKIMLSLGGWGGCRDCSDIFSTKKGRRVFARSVNELLQYFNADGIDLDWEYPAIAGYPGHLFQAADKQNFTALVKRLRKKLGNKKLISFAAGGFSEFLNQSVEWPTVMKYADFVNLMTYDLVNGGSTSTGHHTPLYSTPTQKESGDNAVNYLIAAGIPPGKLVIGAAFYGRLFDSVQNINNGLYQPARFRSYMPGRVIAEQLTEKDGYSYYWDDVAKAPYYYNAVSQTFVTFENAQSLALKVKYVMEKKLYGIMFWQLTEDKMQDGLLKAIIDAFTK